MQIISGKAGGINLKVPHGESVRPTSGFSRKALFDSLDSFEEKIVADFFAGSGALGLEAASRGAKKVIFVEKIRKNCDCINENILRVLKAGANFQAKVFNNDVFFLFHHHYSLVGEKPDIIFADPPYSKSPEIITRLLQSANFANWADKGILIWEVSDIKDINFETIFWGLEKFRKFGGAYFLFFKRKR